MKKIIHIVCLVLMVLPFKGVCQGRHFQEDDDFRRAKVSIGGGGFFAGRHVANYYNGRQDNVNTIGDAWRNTVFLDQVRGRLQDRYGSGRFEVFEYDLPERMRYRLTTAVSFRASFNLSSYTSIFFQVNQLNLTATDVFFVTLLDVFQGGTSERVRVQSRIWGRESRTMLDVGFQWRDNLQARNWQWFYELGLNVTNTRVRSNDIEIEGLRHTIMNQGSYIPGQGWSTIAAPESAWGIGLLGSFGWRYVVNPTASLDFGATVYLQDINLTGYTRFHTSFNLFARLNFLMF